MLIDLVFQVQESPLQPLCLRSQSWLFPVQINIDCWALATKKGAHSC